MERSAGADVLEGALDRVCEDDWDLIWNTLSTRLTGLDLGFVTFCERGMDRIPVAPLPSLPSLSPLPMLESFPFATPPDYLQQETVACTLEEGRLRHIVGITPAQQFEWIQACPRIKVPDVQGPDSLGKYLKGLPPSLLGLLMRYHRKLPELTFVKLEMIPTYRTKS